MENYQDEKNIPFIVTITSILATTVLLSLTGNTLVCLVTVLYRNRSLRTITDFYVLSLALADLTAAVGLFPFGTVAYGLNRWPFCFNFCQFHRFALVNWGQMSTYTLTLTSIN